MADYFAALAARTLRPELGVQPRQRGRWEEAAEPIADAFRPSAQGFVDGERSRALDEAEPPHRVRRKPTAELSPPEGEPVEPRRPRGKRKAGGDHDDTSAAPAPTPHPTVRTLEPTVQVRLERVVARPEIVPGGRPAAAGERAGTGARANRSERARPISTPLSTPRQSPAEPAIRIHIGRVDVRAVTAREAASSPSASRDSKRALMSIDEYVQKRDRGTS